MVVLLWLYVSSIAILVGAELNAEIEHASPHGKSRGAEDARGPPPCSGPGPHDWRKNAQRAGPPDAAPAPWPPPPAAEPAHGPALGAVAAVVILAARAWNDARAKDVRDDRTDAPPQVS